MSPLLAHSGHFRTEFQCPLLGVKRTLDGMSGMSAYDPKRTFGGGARLMENMEYRRSDDRRYSTLMPAVRITLPHFSVSSVMNLANSAGELTNGCPPKSTRRAWKLESARIALTALLSLSMISTGVFAGAPRP